MLRADGRRHSPAALRRGSQPRQPRHYPPGTLAIALGVIGLLILSSLAGLVALSGAVILHEGSTIVVVLNALRLLRYKEPASFHPPRFPLLHCPEPLKDLTPPATHTPLITPHRAK